MQNNPVQNNPTAFWLGLVVTFVGLVGMVYYVFIASGHPHLKHTILFLVIAAAGAALASFARPRVPISETSQ
jgi:FtsH-binding integral membrane protein